MHFDDSDKQLTSVELPTDKTDGKASESSDELEAELEAVKEEMSGRKRRDSVEIAKEHRLELLNEKSS